MPAAVDVLRSQNYKELYGQPINIAMVTMFSHPTNVQNFHYNM